MTEHPDFLTNQAQVRTIKRGGMQSADSAAMEAMYDALDSGVSKEEAEKVFNNTYIKVINKKP